MPQLRRELSEARIAEGTHTPWKNTHTAAHQPLGPVGATDSLYPKPNILGPDFKCSI